MNELRRQATFGALGGMIAGCFSPREGYYPIWMDETFVSDSSVDAASGELCGDALDNPSGGWVQESGSDGYTFALPTTCSADDYGEPEFTLSISCELSGRAFTCGLTEEHETCRDTGDSAPPSEPMEEGDETLISRGVSIRGEWTSRKAFEGHWASWVVDYNSGAGPCDDKPAVDEWANVYFIYSRLSDQ